MHFLTYVSNMIAGQKQAFTMISSGWKIRVFGMLFCLLLSGPWSVSWASVSSSDDASPLAPFNRYSPSETYTSLLEGVQRLEVQYELYKKDKSFQNLNEIRYLFSRLRSLLDLSDIPPSHRVKTGNAAITYLGDILARLPFVDPQSIPGALPDPGQLPDRWTIPGTDIQIAKIHSGPNAGEYLFTPESIARLPEYLSRVSDRELMQERKFPSLRNEHIHATGPLIPEWFVERVPAPLKTIYLNTPLWKILGISLVLMLLLVLVLGWLRLVKFKTQRTSELRRLVWRFTLPVFFLMLYFLSVWFVIDHLNPAGAFADAEVFLTTALLYVISAWAVWIGTFLLVETIIHSPKIPNNSFDAHLLRLTGRVFAIVSVGGILMYGANEMGIPALGLVAGVGAGGFALALASQSTIENLFGGLSLFADRPFRIGDTISFGGERGKVEMVGSRSSRIRSTDGTLVTVPNSDLAKMQIINHTRRNKCLMLQTLSLEVDTSVSTITVFLERLRTLVRNNEMVESSESSPRIRLVGMAPGRLEIQIRAQVLTEEYSVFLGVQETLLLQVLSVIDEMEIKLAKPMLVSTS